MSTETTQQQPSRRPVLAAPVPASPAAGRRAVGPAAPPARAQTRWQTWGLRAAFYGGLFALWQIAAARQIWPPYLLPSPGDVWGFLRQAGGDGTLLPAVVMSAQRVGVGFALALAAGTLLGLVLARVRLVDETVGSAVVGLQSLPSICWFPLALLWFGLNERAVLFVVVMGALFAVTLAVRASVRGLPPLTLRAAQMLGAGTGPRLWWHVLLPAILPGYLSGMRQGWAFAWRSLMAAELLSHSLRQGVGHLLSNGRDLNDMAMVLGMIGVILVIGLLVDRLVFFPLERVIARRWGVEGA